MNIGKKDKNTKKETVKPTDKAEPKAKYTEPEIDLFNKEASVVDSSEKDTATRTPENLIRDKRGKSEKVFQEFDTNDDKQIENEMKGILSEDYLYEKVVEEDDNGVKLEKPYTVWGFSYAGAKRMMKVQRNMETVSVIPVDNGKEHVYTVIVKDTKNGISLPGLAKERKGSTYAEAKALGKATRNAIIAVASEETKEEVFKAYYEIKYKKQLSSEQIIIVGDYINIKEIIK
jgi:hypothetical protein